MKKIVSLVASLVVLLATAAGCAWIVYHPPGFLRVKEVVVTSPLKRLTEFDLIRLSEVKKGDNIVRLSLAKVRSNLLRYPWIKDVSLSKRVPARLFIWVEEQEPVALLDIPSPAKGGEEQGSNLYLVNREGKVFKKVEAGDPKDFPIITGLRPDEIPETLPRLMALVKGAEESEVLSTLGVSELRWDERGGVALYTKEPCIRLELGDSDFEDKLQRFASSWGMIRSSSKNPKVVDLSMDRRIVVKQGL